MNRLASHPTTSPTSNHVKHHTSNPPGSKAICVTPSARPQYWRRVLTEPSLRLRPPAPQGVRWAASPPPGTIASPRSPLALSLARVPGSDRAGASAVRSGAVLPGPEAVGVPPGGRAPWAAGTRQVGRSTRRAAARLAPRSRTSISSARLDGLAATPARRPGRRGSPRRRRYYGDAGDGARFATCPLRGPRGRRGRRGLRLSQG